MKYWIITGGKERVIGIYTIMKIEGSHYISVYVYRLLPWIPQKILPASIERIRGYMEDESNLVYNHESESPELLEELIVKDLADLDPGNSIVTVVEDAWEPEIREIKLKTLHHWPV